MAQNEIYARVPFKYNGHNLDRGEVYKLEDQRNDEKLLAIGHVKLFIGREHRRLKCDDCGRAFITDTFRTAHKMKKHCDEPQENITHSEMAMLLDVDEQKFKFDIDDSPIRPV